MGSSIPNFTAPLKPSSAPRVFNDDLLTNSGDLEYARRQFPEAFHLLDHPELRNVFVGYERSANNARSWMRWLGCLAVAFGTIALLSTATEPLWSNYKYAKVLTIGFEFCGLLAAFIAVGSLWLGPWKKRWLESRFMAERLRQWHFQLILRKGREVEALLDQSAPQALEAYKSIRKKWFDGFLHDFGGKLDSRMHMLMKDPEFSGDWLHHPVTNYSGNGHALRYVFEAYRHLRFNHQYDYATHKLSNSTEHPPWAFLKWPLVRQESAIRVCGSFCLVAALICSVCVITNRYFEIKPDLGPCLASVALSLAICGVALRTVLEGLGIGEDIERYEDYRGKVRRLLLYFEDSSGHQEKLKLMEDMELAVVDELRGFLRTHQKATFVL
jgi:hypothetical protein